MYTDKHTTSTPITAPQSRQCTAQSPNGKLSALGMVQLDCWGSWKCRFTGSPNEQLEGVLGSTQQRTHCGLVFMLTCFATSILDHGIILFVRQTGICTGLHCGRNERRPAAGKSHPCRHHGPAPKAGRREQTRCRNPATLVSGGSVISHSVVRW